MPAPILMCVSGKKSDFAGPGADGALGSGRFRVSHLSPPGSADWIAPEELARRVPLHLQHGGWRPVLTGHCDLDRCAADLADWAMS